MTGTLVDFPAGVVRGTGRVVHVLDLPEGPGVVTDRSPFHPVDPTWPDQPADTGTLNGHPVIACLVGAVGADGTAVGEAITARRGDAGFDWVVVHVIDGPAPTVGDEVELQVDADRRLALSRAHTACHVVALALNAEVAGAWRKEVATDGAGNPDFDRIALTESRMTPDEARDTYRLGKSLRKKGFDTAVLLEDAQAVAARVNERVQAWIEADGRVAIETQGPALTDLRYWCCDVPDGSYRIACGGTHVTSLRELGEVRVAYEQPEPGTLVAVTTVVPPA